MSGWGKRKHNRLSKDLTRAMVLNGTQRIVTIPREMCRWKKIEKGAVLKWSDAGPGGLLIEVLEV